jgi:hypothetical protein
MAKQVVEVDELPLNTHLLIVAPDLFSALANQIPKLAQSPPIFALPIKVSKYLTEGSGIAMDDQGKVVAIIKTVKKDAAGGPAPVRRT